MPTRTVLIIDDDKAWSKVLSRYFSQYKYKVYTAATGAEGIALAAQHLPGCILLDYHLAECDATEVCKRLKAVEAIRNIPILIMSNDETRDGSAYQECGAFSFVMKLGPLHKILAAVENLFKLIRLSQGVLEKGDLRLEPLGLRAYYDRQPLPELTREQFRFLYLLVDKSPDFVTEDFLAKHVFASEPEKERTDSLRGLEQRIRTQLGPWLGRRIRNKTGSGWVYVEPKP